VVACDVELLGGAGDDPVDHLLEAILTGDGDAARSLVRADPGLVDMLGPVELAALVGAAEHGNVASVSLMLELGFPIDAGGASRSNGRSSAAARIQPAPRHPTG
jgi:hypothetical protein